MPQKCPSCCYIRGGWSGDFYIVIDLDARSALWDVEIVVFNVLRPCFQNLSLNWLTSRFALHEHTNRVKQSTRLLCCFVDMAHPWVTHSKKWFYLCEPGRVSDADPTDEVRSVTATHFLYTINSSSVIVRHCSIRVKAICCNGGKDGRRWIADLEIRHAKCKRVIF